MEVVLKPGKYVVAVSGGVDSVVLLNLLHHENSTYRVRPCKLVVAHFDHGIRGNSREDRVFVQKLAESYGLPFVFDEGKLGAGASEAIARESRYKFLRRVKEISGADAIVTAHHEDDLLETAILNLLRGTGRKGLSSLKSTDEIRRPLLGIPKRKLKDYALSNGLEWREDPTNSNIKYKRNYIRHKILLRFTDEDRRKLRELIDVAHRSNAEIDEILAGFLSLHPDASVLDRQWFVMLPHAVSREVLAAWLRSFTIEFDKKSIERIVAAAKTFSPGKLIDADAGHVIMVEKGVLALAERER